MRQDPVELIATFFGAIGFFIMLCAVGLALMQPAQVLPYICGFGLGIGLFFILAGVRIWRVWSQQTSAVRETRMDGVDHNEVNALVNAGDADTVITVVHNCPAMKLSPPDDDPRSVDGGLPHGSRRAGSRSVIQQFFVKRPMSDIDFTGAAFERLIGSDGRLNAFGTVVCEKRSNSLVLETTPVICGHGGSQWLCATCADNIREGLIGTSAAKPCDNK